MPIRARPIWRLLVSVRLAGFALYAFFGFWWTDPIAAFLMVPVVAKEEVEALRGESCDFHL